MRVYNRDTIATGAEQSRLDAERAYRTSEYPGYGRAAHQEKADTLDALAETLDEIGYEPPEHVSNRRESRRESRVYWLRRRAAEKRVESASLAAESHDMASTRPLGQPLQGSPARRRAQQNSMDRERRKDEKAHEAYVEAKDLDRRADAAELNTAIYSDDIHAIEKLEAKLSGLERMRSQMKATRKKKTLPLLNYESETYEFQPRGTNGNDVLKCHRLTKAEYKGFRSEIRSTRIPVGCAHRLRVVFVSTATNGYLSGYWAVAFLTDSKVHAKPENETPMQDAEGVPAYALANIGKQIKSVRDRIEEVKQRDEFTCRGERHIGDVRITDNIEFHKVELWFPDKPSEETRSLLKSLGFRWIRSAGCWSRGINNATEYRLGQLSRHLGEPLTDGEAE